jgi:hypothetical protein
MSAASRPAWSISWPRPILEWAARYPLLAVVLALPLWVVWGGGEDLGLPSLFHDFWAGLALTMLLGEICFIGYLLDADEPWAAQKGEAPSVSWYFWSTFTFPILLALGTLPALLAGRWRFVSGAAVAVGATLALNRLARSVQEYRVRHPPGLLDRLGEATDRLGAREQWPWRLGVKRPRLHALQLIAFGMALIGYGGTVVAVATGAWDAPPAMIACLICGLGAQLYGLAHFVFPYRHFGAVTAALLFGAFLWNTFGGRPSYGGLPGPGGPDARLSDAQAMDAWRSRWSGACGEGPQPRLAVIATSGGGIRAASWTAEILQRMERAYPHFRRHVRLVTGASGGMVAAGAWVASLERDGARPVGERGLADAMEQDTLSDLVREILVPFRSDRGAALERAFIQHSGGVMKRTFLELRDGEAAGWRPSLVFTPMVVEDGRRLLVTNLALDDLASSTGPVLRKEGPPPEPVTLLSRAAYQLFADYPGSQADFTVASGARMSASFAWISPAAELPPTAAIPAPRRVVDAGYYDNYGVDLAVAWIHERRDWLARCTSGVLLVQIRDSLRLGGNLGAGQGVALARAELASPLEGLLAAREASMVFRNDGLIHMVGGDMNGGGTLRFATLAFESSLSAPLSWNLTPEDVAGLREAADAKDIAAQIDAMKQWLSGAGSGVATVSLREE